MMLAALINLEFRILKNEFLLSLRDRRYLSSYIIVVLTGVSVYTGLGFFLELGGVSSLIDIIEVPISGISLRWVSPFLLIYSVIKGLSPTMASSIFTSTDIAILFTRPVRPQEIYISKLIKNGIKRIVYLVFFFLSSSPLFSYFELGLGAVGVLFFLVFILIEIAQLISHVMFFMIYRLSEGYETRNGAVKGVFFALILLIGFSVFDVFFMKTGINVFNYCNVLMNSPEIMISVFKSRTGLRDILLECISPLLLIIGVLVFASVNLVRGYYGGNQSLGSALFNQDRLFGNVLLPFRYGRSKTYQLLYKDLLLIIRSYGMQIITSLVLTIGLAMSIIRYQEVIKRLFFESDILQNTFPFLLIIYLKMILIPNDAIDREWGCLWLVRSSNTSHEIIFYAKVVLGYLISIPFIVPLLVSMFALDNSWSNLILVINLTFLFTPVKIFTSNYFSQGTDPSIDLFLSNFLQILSMFIIWIFFSALYTTQVSVMFYYSAIIATLFFTKYGRPIIYYVFELISNFYFFSLLLAVLLGASIVMVSFLRITYLMQDWDTVFRAIWFMVASFSTSYILRDYIINWTLPLFSE